MTTSLLKSPGLFSAFWMIQKNTVVWIVSTRPLISKSSNPFTKALVTGPRAPITIGFTVTFMLHSFFQFLIKVEELILLFAFFQVYSMVSRDSKVQISASSHFLNWITSTRKFGEQLRTTYGNSGQLVRPY